MSEEHPNTLPMPRRAVLPVAKFKHRGREWTIRTRRPGDDAKWYLYFEFERRRFPFALGTSSKAVAISEAKLKIDLFFEEREARLRGQFTPLAARDYSPLSALIGREGTEDDGLLYVVPTRKRASPGTRKRYAAAVRWVLKLALGLDADADVERLSMAVFSRDTARRFFAEVDKRAALIDDQSTRRRWLAGAYGKWNHAQALTAAMPVNALTETHGLKFPPMADWRAGRKTYSQHVPKVRGVEVPDGRLIARTLREWIRIAETPGYEVPGVRRSTPYAGDDDFTLAPLTEIDRRNLFIAVGLELSCGLRAGEAHLVKRHWFEKDGKGFPLLKCYHTQAKNQTGKIEVTPLDPFWRVLWFWIRKNGWDVGPEEFILSARPTERMASGAMKTKGNICDRTVWPQIHASHWLRGLGWKTQKTNHALRDYSASMVTMRYGLGPACRWCRHENMATTERSYNRFVSVERERDEKRLRWIRWAK